MYDLYLQVLRVAVLFIGLRLKTKERLKFCDVKTALGTSAECSHASREECKWAQGFWRDSGKLWQETEEKKSYLFIH